MVNTASNPYTSVLWFVKRMEIMKEYIFDKILGATDGQMRNTKKAIALENPTQCPHQIRLGQTLEVPLGQQE